MLIKSRYNNLQQPIIQMKRKKKKEKENVF